MIREVTNMNKHELYHNHNYVYLLTSNIINRCGDWEYPKVCVNLKTDVR